MSSRSSEYSTFDKMRIDSQDDTVSSNSFSDQHESDSFISDSSQPSFLRGMKAILISPINILFIFIPIAFCARYLGWGDSVVFITSLLALAPLAERMGFVTEQIALHTNDTIGALLTASFPNITELIVALAAMYQGLFRLVQLLLLGSILSNMLFVLGAAFFFGGLQSPTQHFGKISSQVNSTLLMLSTCGVMLPTALTLSGQISTHGMLFFSRAASVILLVVYVAFLYFQLKTHKSSYEAKSQQPVTISRHSVSSGYNLANYNPTSSSLIRDDEDPESGASFLRSHSSERFVRDSFEPDVEPTVVVEDKLGLWWAIVWLAVITVFIAFLSLFLTDTIESGADGLGVSALFLSAIVLPLAGNAAESSSAVYFALKGRLDMSLGVAIGSSTQVALLMLPLCVLIGWISGLDMSLNFGAYESLSLLLSVITVTFAIKDGKSNWLLGFGLVAVYVMIAVGFFTDTDDSLT